MLFRSSQLYAGHGDAWLADPTTSPCSLGDCSGLVPSSSSLAWQAARLGATTPAGSTIPGLGSIDNLSWAAPPPANADADSDAAGGSEGGYATNTTDPDDMQGLPTDLNRQALPPSMLPGELARPQLLMYYRHDLFASAGMTPPSTWSDLADWAEAVNGTLDADGDGAGDWALCLDTTACKSGFIVLAMMASAVQPSTEYGTFFHPENLYPLVGSSAFVQVLTTLRRLARVSVPAASGTDPLACRPHDPAFTAGRCLLTIAFDQLRDLADGYGYGAAASGSTSGGGATASPPATSDPTSSSSSSSRTLLQAAGPGDGASTSPPPPPAPGASLRRGALPPGALGVAPLPGSETLYSRRYYSMSPCTLRRCPNAVNTTCAVQGDYRQRRPCLVNRAPVVVSLSYDTVLAPYSPAAATSRLASLALAMEVESRSWFGALAQTLDRAAAVSGGGGGGSDAAAGGRRRALSVEEWTRLEALTRLGVSAEEAARYLAVYWTSLLGPDGTGGSHTTAGSPATNTSAPASSSSSSTADGADADDSPGPHQNVVCELGIRGSSYFTAVYAQAAYWVVSDAATPLQASYLALYSSEELLARLALNRTRLTYKYCSDIGWVGEYGIQYGSGQSGGGGGGLSAGELAAAIVASVAAALACCVLLALGLMAARRRGGVALGPPGPGLGTTLLLTDIQNSTVLWETLPAEVMDSALRCHHEVLRGLLPEHRGYESATEGDAFILAFHAAEDAANYAIVAQERLAAASWPEDMLSHPDCEVVWVAPQRSDPIASLSYVSKELLHVITRAVQTGVGPLLPSAGGAGAAASPGGGGGGGSAVAAAGPPLRASLRGASSIISGFGGGSFVGSGGTPSPLGSVVSALTWLWRYGSSRYTGTGSITAPPAAGGGGAEAAAPAAAAAAAACADAQKSRRQSRGGSDGGAAVTGRAQSAGGGGGTAGATGSSPTSSARRKPLDLLVHVTRTHSILGGRAGSASGGPAAAADRAAAAAAAAAAALPPPLAALQRLSALGKVPSDIRSYMTDSEEGLEDGSAAPAAAESGGTSGAAAAGGAGAGASTEGGASLAAGVGAANGGGGGGLLGGRPAVSSLTEALRHGWRRCAAPGAGDAGGEQLLAFRGMRVRMGIHTGADLTEVSLNKATGRTQYSGAFMTAAKTVCDAAHGGQVLLSAATFKRLPPACLSKSAFLLHMGEHAMGDEGAAATAAAARARTLNLTAALAAAAAADGEGKEDDGAAAAAAAAAATAAAAAAEPAPEALYQLLPYALSCRLPFFEPLRTHSYLSLGLPDAPVGRVTVAFMYVVGAQALLAWNPVVAGEALGLFQDTVSEQLSAADGYVVELVDGLCLATFRSAADALLWSLRCGRLLLAANWSEELLEHELCEEVALPVHGDWAEPLPSPSQAQVQAAIAAWRPDGAAAPAVSPRSRLPAPTQTLTRTAALRYRTIMRGLRLKVGMDTGLVADTINATTGRMAYRGRPMNRAARIASRAHAGGVHCSAAVWAAAAERLALLARSGGEDEVTASSLGLQSLKGVMDKIEVMSVSYKGTALSAEEEAVVARRGPRASSGSGALTASSPGGLLSGLASAFSLGGGGGPAGSAGSAAFTGASRISARNSLFGRTSAGGNSLAIRAPSTELRAPPSSRPSPTLPRDRRSPVSSVSASLGKILRGVGASGTGAGGDAASDVSIGNGGAGAGAGLQNANSAPLPVEMRLSCDGGCGVGLELGQGFRLGTSPAKVNFSTAAAASVCGGGLSPTAAAAVARSPRRSGTGVGGLSGTYGSGSTDHIILHMNPLHEGQAEAEVQVVEPTAQGNSRSSSGDGDGGTVALRFLGLPVHRGAAPASAPVPSLAPLPIGVTAAAASAAAAAAAAATAATAYGSTDAATPIAAAAGGSGGGAAEPPGALERVVTFGRAGAALSMPPR